jgi:hypothetical protein
VSSTLGRLIDGGLLAKSGAGGSGRLGLPPYNDEGVPGRGAPFISAGSYGTNDGGALCRSPPACEGVHALVGEPERVGDRGGIYAGNSLSGGAITGISLSIEFVRE